MIHTIPVHIYEISKLYRFCFLIPGIMNFYFQKAYKLCYILNFESIAFNQFTHEPHLYN